MQWQGRRGSSNIDDRRAQGGGVTGRGCGLTGGIGTLVIALVFWLLGVIPYK